MPRQTRVNPAGEIVANAARGTLMGNRGCLHDAQGAVVRNSARKQWVCCRLEFKGIKRKLLSPGNYTELFFLDEATALAAGHRPCNTCLREEARHFAQTWALGNRIGRDSASVGEMDDILSQQRTEQTRLVLSEFDTLPLGAIFRHEASGRFFLKRSEDLLPWSFEGYGPSTHIGTLSGPVKLMTPWSTVLALREGYRPALHPSAHDATTLAT